MQQTTDYEKDTLNAYRSKQRAAEYKRYHTRDWSWARITTWREQCLLVRELCRYQWSTEDRVLDIPCGTGILGRLLHSFPFQIVASDISREMIELARGEYPQDRLLGFVQSDITCTGFPPNAYDCVVVLGFMHRVPQVIKQVTLQEISRLTSRVTVVTCSEDSPIQRLKKKVLSVIWGEHVSAPCSIPLLEMIGLCEAAGFRVVCTKRVIPFLSADVILVLEKQ